VTRAWSLEEAEAHLLSLELFGMRFGLERMRRLLMVLGSPQERFAAIHVVGTNGKSSTVRYTAALLEAHGVRTGSYLSPHLVSYAERVRIGDSDLDGDAFAAAVQRAAAAAATVERGLEEGERVTQFELVTAAAFDELARRGVEVAVVEAGLGGRHDATNVLGAPVCVLTTVGLEHTRWLGPTVRHIAREKLAVVRPDAVLVLGDVPAEVDEDVAATGARVVRGQDTGVALPGYQQQNFALAAAAAREQIGSLDPARVAEAAARTTVPGRLQRIADAPLTILDGAHNPSGVEALVGALDGVLGDAAPRSVAREETAAPRSVAPDEAAAPRSVAADMAAAPRDVVAVVSVLDDKDAAGMLRPLLPRCRAVVFTASANPRVLPPATLASLAGQLGGPGGGGAVEVVPEPHAALARAQAIAGPDGAVLATGSIYLVADLLRPAGRRRVSAL
jgi:dihydrofolate synthase / folylpolyglutamate synthase